MRVTVSVVILTLLALALLAGCGGGGSPSTGQVVGHLYLTADQTGLTNVPTSTPAGQALVIVQGTTVRVSTAADGSFVLNNVPAGQRILLVSRTGVKSAGISVVVPMGGKVDIAAGALNPITRLWTVLVYMNADNNLEPFSLQNVNEMESVPDSEQVSILLQWDRGPGEPGTPGTWTGARRYQIRHDDDTSTINSPLLQNLGDTDMGNPATLQDFIKWGEQTCPAQHYMVVVWNHGSGWLDVPYTKKKVLPRGVSYDDTAKDFISTLNIPVALQSPTPLDLVAFDASLMQMAEVAYQMRTVCPYIVGSEESPPGHGYAYDQWLGPLIANPNMSGKDLGVTIANSMLSYYGANSNITQSVVETDKLENLATAITTFSAALIPLATTDAVQLAAARDSAESYYYPYYQANKDMYSYAQLVKAKVNDLGVDNAADGVITAFNQAVIANVHGNLHANSNGLAIYVPAPAEYAQYATSYSALAFAQRTHWDQWLAAQTQ